MLTHEERASAVDGHDRLDRLRSIEERTGVSRRAVVDDDADVQLVGHGAQGVDEVWRREIEGHRARVDVVLFDDVLGHLLQRLAASSRDDHIEPSGREPTRVRLAQAFRGTEHDTPRSIGLRESHRPSLLRFPTIEVVSEHSLRYRPTP